MEMSGRVSATLIGDGVMTRGGEFSGITARTLVGVSAADGVVRHVGAPGWHKVRQA